MLSVPNISDRSRYLRILGIRSTLLRTSFCAHFTGSIKSLRTFGKQCVKLVLHQFLLRSPTGSEPSSLRPSVSAASLTFRFTIPYISPTSHSSSTRPTHHTTAVSTETTACPTLLLIAPLAHAPRSLVPACLPHVPFLSPPALPSWRLSAHPFHCLCPCPFSRQSPRKMAPLIHPHFITVLICFFPTSCGLR